MSFSSVRQRLRLLGVPVDLVTMSQLNEIIADAIRNNQKIVIAGQNLHSVYLYHRDIRMQQFYEKSHVIRIDGMPLIFWGKLLRYPMKSTNRITYMDWIYPLIRFIHSNGWQIFYLGGKPGVAEKAAQKLRQIFQGLNIETHHGYFPPQDSPSVLETINKFHPHVLMVGMGMPKQEHWVLDNLEYLNANAILTSGACFDLHAGVIPTPPRWMGRIGLEWLYRLLSEPRRLARRYLVEPWSLIPWAIRDTKERYLSKSKNYQHN